MINEINVISAAEQEVSGYNNILVQNIPEITNGYVKSIICNCLDTLSFNDRNILFLELLNKLCINGVMSIKFVSLSLLPNKIISGDLTGQKISEILPTMNSCWSHNDFSELMISSKGYVISKLFNDYIYTVASIQKVQ